MCSYKETVFLQYRHKQLDSYGLLSYLFSLFGECKFWTFSRCTKNMPFFWNNKRFWREYMMREFFLGGWTITCGLNSAPAFRNCKLSVQVGILCSFWMWLEQWSQSAVLSQYINNRSSICLLTNLSRSGFSCDVELMNCFNASIPLLWGHITHVKCSIPDLMDGDYLYWLIAVV